MKRIAILDIPFDRVTLHQALTIILKRLSAAESKAFFVATPNPEMLLAASHNSHFKKILQHTDLNIPDGVGIIFASKIMKTPLPERVTGIDLMKEICKHAPKTTKIFLLGAGEGVAQKVKEKLEQSSPHIDIVGIYSGSVLTDDEKYIRTMIQNSGAEILFVAFGAPKQELWLARNLFYLHGIKIAMGVGGAFDFIAGVRQRAPRWMQKLGIEWLYRLIQQPSRIRRIYYATVKFPLVFMIRTLKDALRRKR